MTRLTELGWVRRETTTRALSVTEAGRANLPLRLGVTLP
jgi:hypothetical protein